MKRKIALRLFVLFFIPFIWQAKANPMTTLVAPPANDECSSATDLTVNPNYLCTNVASGTVEDATTSTASNGCPSTPANPLDVWYKFVATSISHRVVINNVVGGDTDMYHMVYNGGASADCTSMALIFCSDDDVSELDANNIGFDLIPGNTYFIRVFTKSGTAVNTIFDICVGTAATSSPNDECANAEAMTLPFDELVDASPATNNNGFITAAGCIDVNDGVWYTFTGQANYEYDITVTPTSWDTSIVVYKGNCGALTCVNDSNQGGVGVVEALSFVSTGTDIYYINVAYPSGTVDAPEGVFTITANGQPLSLSDIVAKGFYYYPNPVKNTLKMTAKEQINQISIYTVLGREVKKLSESDLADFNVEIDFSSFPRGTYFVRAVVGGDSGVFKVIKD